MRTYIIGALALLTLASVPSRSESLNEMYQHALQNDHNFKAAQAAYDAGLQEKNIGRSNLLPKISGEASWTDSENESDPSSNIRPEESTSSGYGLSLTQPIIDFSAWHSYKRGKVASKAAEAQFKAKQQALIVRTATAYFDALRAVDIFETAKAEENANRSQLEQTQKRFEVGLTAITEVHEAQAAYDNSLARRLLAEGNVGIAYEALEVITGQSYQALLPLKKDFPIVSPSPEKREAWVEFATKNNFNLAAASLNAETARQLANQSKAGHFPTLTASATYGETNTETLLSGTTAETDTTDQAVALTLKVPLFLGGEISARRKQAASQFIEARENYFQAQRDTIQQARSLHLTVLTDVATVKARKQATISSQSALDATQAGYEVGTRDLVDVLIAQRGLFSAQSNYSDALYTYVLNTLKLKEVAGLLSEKDVLELDKWLDTSRTVVRSTY
ncbi:MAG: TolC family outer membrane protein [Agarilytica sp.]